MSKSIIFKSKLAPFIKSLIALKRSNGFVYTSQEYILIFFDEFCYNHKELDNGILSKKIIDLWCVLRPTEDKNYRNNRVSVTRQLGLYLLSIGEKSYIPHNQGSTTTAVPYIPSFKQLQKFFNYVDYYIPLKTYSTYDSMNTIYPVLFRLMFCCGLRRSEVVNIKSTMIDLDQGTLIIQKSKGLKDRTVYISNDLCELCRNYDKKMNKLLPFRVYFFPGRKIDHHVTTATVGANFNKFWINTFPNWENKFPTSHALRYCFVIMRMERWMKEGKDLEVKMPFLSKFLGHSSVEETYYYYHNLESVASIIKSKDSRLVEIIPEVMDYEE